jgi:uncharacterized protein (TIGR02284 family)
MSSHDTTVLNTLIATTIDSAQGYSEAAERSLDENLKPIFNQLARERHQTADRLKNEVRHAGGVPRDEGTLKAAAHRRWLDLKDTLTKGDKAVLSSVAAGETYIREKYEAALTDNELSPGVRDAIEQAFISVASGQAQVSELQHRGSLPETAQGSMDSWSKVGLGIGALAAIAGVAMATNARRKSSNGADGNNGFTLRLQTDESMRMISSRKVEGTAVFGRDGERLGKIDSFMVDKYSGRVGYAVMTFGGVMGAGESLLPLPWAVLTYNTEQDGYVINVTKEDLEEAPRFKASDEPEFSPEYRRQILVFYRSSGAGGSASSADGRSLFGVGQRLRTIDEHDTAAPASSGRASKKKRAGRKATSDVGQLGRGEPDQSVVQGALSGQNFGSAGAPYAASSGGDSVRT